MTELPMPEPLSTLTAIMPRVLNLLETLPLSSIFTHMWQSYLNRRFHGLYKVNKHHASLYLSDARGKRVVYTKTQRVTFLRDDVFAIQDQWWGDGDIFAEYQCVPGVAVDRWKEGYRWKVLISLRTTKHAGDEEEFRIRRVIADGFMSPTGNFQTQIDHPTEYLSMSVTFPQKRLPKIVMLIEQNSRRSHVLGPEEFQLQPNGEVVYLWSTNQPRLYEAYIMRWEW